MYGDYQILVPCIFPRFVESVNIASRAGQASAQGTKHELA